MRSLASLMFHRDLLKSRILAGTSTGPEKRAELAHLNNAIENYPGRRDDAPIIKMEKEE